MSDEHFSDEFLGAVSPGELSRRARGWALYQGAQADQDYALLRHLWAHLDAPGRARLRAALQKLAEGSAELAAASGGLLAAPKVAMDGEHAAVLCGEGRNRPPYSTVAALEDEFYMHPDDMVRALDAWGREEVFVPDDSASMPAFPDPYNRASADS
jgi:hypothetical protein